MSPVQLHCQDRLGHGGINALAVVGKRTPRLLVAAHDGLRVHKTEKLDRLSELRMDHDAPITSMCVEPAPSGREFFDAFFATGSAAGHIRVFSLNQQARPVKVARLDLDAPIHDISWSRPGAGTGPRGRLAACLADGSLLVWRPDTDEQWRRAYSDEPLYGLDWFPDGAHIACAGEDGQLRVVEWPSGAEAEGGLFRHYNAIEGLRVSACGRYLAYVSGDEKAGLFDLARRETRAFGPAGDPVCALGWHPEKTVLVIGTQSGASLHYDVEADRLRPSTGARTHVHPVETAVFDPAGLRAYTGGRDGWIFGNEIKEGQWAQTYASTPTPAGYVLSLTWVDDKTLAAGHSDGWICTWEPDLSSERLVQKTRHNHAGPVYALDHSPKGRSVLASGSVDKHLRIYDLPLKELALDLGEIHNKPIYGVSFSPDGRYVATGSADTYLVVYDVHALQEKANEKFGKEEYWHFAVQNRILNCVAWNPAGGLVAVGLSNHQVVILPVDAEGHLRKGPTLKGHTDSVSAVAWEKDGTHLWSVGYDKRLIRWRASDWRAICTKHIADGDPLQSVAVHPDKPLVATGDWDARLRLFDLAGQELGCWRWPHYNAVESLDFSPDGKRLASASSDGLICVWTWKGLKT